MVNLHYKVLSDQKNNLTILIHMLSWAPEGASKGAIVLMCHQFLKTLMGDYHIFKCKRLP